MFIAAKLFFPSFIQFIRVDTNVASLVFSDLFCPLYVFALFLFFFFFNYVRKVHQHFVGANKTIIPLALVVYEIIANIALPASLAGICHLISNSLSWNNCVGCIALTHLQCQFASEIIIYRVYHDKRC